MDDPFAFFVVVVIGILIFGALSWGLIIYFIVKVAKNPRLSGQQKATAVGAIFKAMNAGSSSASNQSGPVEDYVRGQAAQHGIDLNDRR